MQENRQSHNPSTGSGTGFHSGGGSSASGNQGMTGSGSSAETTGDQEGSHNTSGSHMGGSSPSGSHMGTSTGVRSSSSGDGMSEMLGGVLDEMPSTARPQERTEGSIARMIEAQTSKLPSDTFLWGAVGAMGVSAVCELAGWNSKSRFFGQWVAPLLLFGVYNKMVKQHGHDELH